MNQTLHPGHAARNLATLLSVCLSATMLGLEISSIPAILPDLERILPADFRQLQWIVNAYTLAMATGLMACGALADRFGRKRIFMIGIAVFGMASLLCGLAHNAPELIGARFLQGVSGAAMLTCQIAVLSHQFRHGAQRSRAFAAWGITFGAGLGFGPLVGVLIAAVAGWPWVFLIHLALAALTFGLAGWGIVESANPAMSRLDLPGMATLSLAVFALVEVIIDGRGLGADNPLGLMLAALGLLAIVSFVIVENRSARPMFDFRVFRVRPFLGALIGSAGMNFSFWPFVIYLPIHLQAVLGLDAKAAGAMLLAYTLPPLVVPPLAERLLARHGAGTVIPLGLATIGTGFALMLLAAYIRADNWQALLPGCLLAGVGLGLTNTPVTNTSTGALPPEQAGMASAMDTSARIMSLSINIAVMGLILVHGIRNRLPAHDTPAPELDRLARSIAGGDLSAAGRAGWTEAHAALLAGFEDVMLYGAICAWAMGLISLLVFGRKTKEPEAMCVPA